jgi:hypothetical protein
MILWKKVEKNEVWGKMECRGERVKSLTRIGKKRVDKWFR